jgi:hypothetical protein
MSTEMRNVLTNDVFTKERYASGQFCPSKRRMSEESINSAFAAKLGRGRALFVQFAWDFRMHV